MKKRLLTKKNRLAIGVIVLATLAPTIYAASASASSKVTLNVWSWRPEDAAAYKAIFAVYENAHPGVTVNFQTYMATQYPQVLTTGLTGRNGPDIVQTQAYGKIQPYILGGNLVPLDGKVAGLKNIAKANLTGSSGHIDGKIYGVPFANQTIQMFYNKDIFAKLKLSVPTTWKDFIAVNDALKKANIIPMSVGAKDTFLLPLISEAFTSSVYGGSTFEKTMLNGSTTFEDPVYVKAISTFGSMQKYMPDNVVGVSYTDSQTLFISGRAGMFPGGSFELGFFQAQNPNLKIGIFPIPPAPGAASKIALTPGYVDGSWSLNAKSDQQGAALQLLRWMASREFGQLFSNSLSQMSPIKGVTFNNPLLKQMAQNFAKRGAPYLLIADFRWGAPSGTDVMAPGLQKLLLGKTDAAQLATSLQQGISTWFKPKK
jgi:raffinose/stachyose/melibiose transport system substrate-binding protein